MATIRIQSTIVEFRDLLSAIVSPTHRKKQDVHAQTLRKGESDWNRTTLASEVRRPFVYHLQYRSQRSALVLMGEVHTSVARAAAS